MFIGEGKGVLGRRPEKTPEPPKDIGLKVEKGEDAFNFDNMISESNIFRQAEIEREKNEAGGDFRMGETKDERDFRKQLEKVTGKKQNVAKNKLERDDYLNLLVTQLKYQDPSKPMEHYEMASQMAQFNTVEQLMGVNKLLTEMKKLQNDSKAEKLTQYLGKDLEIQGNIIHLDSDGKSNLVKFELPAAASNVIAEIRDDHSKVVKSLHLGFQQVGSNNIEWDGTNDKGVKLPAGNYTFNILAATEDGKPMAAKTSYLAKVEGIKDIFSGGKLDTSVGEADPSKIVAVRNPEMVDSQKLNKNQLAAYMQHSPQNLAGLQSQQIIPQAVGAQQQPVVGAQQQPVVGAQQQPVVGAQQQPVVGAQQQPVVGAQQQPVVGAQQQPVVGAQQQPVVGAQQQPVVGAHALNNKVAAPKRFVEPIKSLEEFEKEAKILETSQLPQNPKAAQPQINYQGVKASPNYGGAPNVNGIHGRVN